MEIPVSVVGIIIVVWIGSWWPNTVGMAIHSFKKISMDYVLWYNIASFILVLTVMFSNKLKWILSWKPIVDFGKISFAFYLLHDPIQASFGSIVYKYFYNLTLSKTVAFVSAFITYVIMGTGAAYLFHRTVDVWMDRVLKRIREQVYPQ